MKQRLRKRLEKVLNEMNDFEFEVEYRKLQIKVWMYENNAPAILLYMYITILPSLTIALAQTEHPITQPLKLGWFSLCIAGLFYYARRKAPVLEPVKRFHFIHERRKKPR